MPFRLVGVTRPERDLLNPGKTLRAKPEEFPLGRRKQLKNAYRKAVSAILGGGPAEVQIFQGDRMVGLCELRNERIRGGNKFYVSCSGEKARKKQG